MHRKMHEGFQVVSDNQTQVAKTKSISLVYRAAVFTVELELYVRAGGSMRQLS